MIRRYNIFICFLLLVIAVGVLLFATNELSTVWSVTYEYRPPNDRQQSECTCKDAQSSMVNNEQQLTMRHSINSNETIQWANISNMEARSPITAKESLSLPIPEASSASDEGTASSRRFLLAVQTYMRCGSNTQYQNFKNAIMLSLMTNRTLVMTPFFLQGGQIGGYTDGFTIDHMRSFTDTFDVDILRELLPLATVQEFKLNCNDTNTKVIVWNRNLKNYNMSRSLLYQDMIDIDLPEEDDVIDVESDGPLDEFMSKIEDEKCLAYTMNKQFLDIVKSSEREDMKRAVNKHLARPSIVRRVADSLSGDICDGGRYITFHFRNKSTEMPCIFGMELYDGHCDIKVKRTREMSELARDAIIDLMKRANIGCIYVACPLWSMEIRDIFSERIARQKVITYLDLQVPTEYKTFLEDFYMLSLVEQGIAFRADIFVGAGFSKWSDFVVEERSAFSRISYSIRDLVRIPADDKTTL
ncbi:uncharacterized protein [Ptychodera flava]|uniref:uncharacterized protein n=1 Tax=Ptychodera flava TaxID=63121 RepID=UPI003969C07F